SELKNLKQEEEETVRPLRRTSSTSSSSSSSAITVLPTPSSPMKHNAGRRKVHVTELQKGTIRLTFHLLLKDRVYPTLENLWSTPLAQQPELENEMIDSDDDNSNDKMQSDSNDDADG
ncbi:unnamed protein product, partial [Didymodactylos carnosus]